MSESADDVAVAVAQSGLAGEHDLLARGRLGEQGAEQRLARAVAVDGRGVDERSARIEERRELLLGLDLVDGRAPNVIVPRPSRETSQTRVTDAALLHDDRVVGRLKTAR